MATLAALLLLSQPAAAQDTNCAVKANVLIADTVEVLCATDQEQLKQLLEEHGRKLARQLVAELRLPETEREKLDAQLEAARTKHQLRELQIAKFLADAGEQGVPVEQYGARLDKVAGDIAQLRRNLAESHAAAPPDTAHLLAEAERAIEEARYADARATLKEIAEANLDAVQEHLLTAAAAYARRGDTFMIEIAYLPAAEEYRKAAGLLAADEDVERWAGYRNSYSHALYRHGLEKGVNASLERAVAAHRETLTRATREALPDVWAQHQNNLGNALSALGERESDTERLEQAVAAYRAALEELTRERVPLDWAMTQNNLGAALQRLGARESGTERLEEAVTAYRAALVERKRERVPLQWAVTQNNLGAALRVLGEREGGTERLEQAVVAYRAAVEERTRQRVPLDWAMTQNNLGAALQRLGARESGTERLEEAVTAYRAALVERKRERVPLQWAMT